MFNEIKNIIKEKILRNDFLKNAGIYTIFGILDKTIPFIVLPIFTRLMDKESLGYYILYQAIVPFIFPLLTVNIVTAITVNYFKIPKQRFKFYFSNGLILFFIIYCLAATLSIIFSNNIAEILKFPSKWFNIILLIVFFEFICRLRLSLWQIEKKTTSYGLFLISRVITRNAFGLSLIIFFHYNWQGIVLGHLIGLAIFTTISIILFYRDGLLTFYIDKNNVKDMLKVGLPLTVHNVGAWLGNLSSRLIVNSLIGKAATGNFGIAATFGVVLTVIQESFNKAYIPFLFENLNRISDKIKNNLVRLTYLYYLFLFTISILIAVVGYFSIGLIFGESYNSNKELVFFFVFASTFNGMYKMHVNYLIYIKKTIYITYATFTTGLLNIFLSYIFVKSYGLIGGAISLILTQFFAYVIIFYISNKKYPLPWLNFLTGVLKSVKNIKNNQ